MSSNISIQITDDTCHIVIDGELNIYTAADLKDELLTLIRDNKAASINLANIEDIDTAGLQILIMLKKEAASLDHQLSFINHSEPVVNIIQLLDMVSLFGDPVVITT